MEVTRSVLLAVVFGHVAFANGPYEDGDTKSALKELLAEGIDADITYFTNLGGTVEREKILVVKPSSVSHMRQCLSVAQKYSLHVRVAGAGHSWSELFPDEGNILLDMSAYGSGNSTIDNYYEQSIYLVSPTGQLPMWQVRVASNIRLKDVNTYLLPHALSFPAPITYSNATIGGIVSTASHGSNWKEDSMSDSLTSITVMNGDGEIREYTQMYDPEVMAGLRACLGACGIILDVTLVVQPLGKIRHSKLSDISVGELFSDPSAIQWLMKSSYTWSARWELFNMATQQERTLVHNPGNRDSISWKPQDDMLDITYFELEHKQSALTRKYITNTTGVNASVLIPVDNGRSQGKTISEGFLQQVIHIRESDDQGDPGVEVEFFINESKENYNGSRTAIDVLSEFIWGWIERLGNIPLHRVEFSWIRRSEKDCYLCPSQVANVSDPVFCLNMYVDSSVEYTFRTNSFFKQLYSALRDEGLRVYPHLAKRHAFLGEFWFQDMPIYYSDNVRKLQKLRSYHRLDADDVFLNKHLRETVLNPDEATVAATSQAAVVCLERSNLLLTVVLLLISYLHLSCESGSMN